MTDDRFRPFETHLDEAAALSILRGTLAGADDGELFLERRRAEALVFDDGRLRNASYDASEGFGLRAVRGEVAGYAHATELSETALVAVKALVRDHWLALVHGADTASWELVHVHAIPNADPSQWGREAERSFWKQDSRENPQNTLPPEAWFGLPKDPSSAPVNQVSVEKSAVENTRPAGFFSRQRFSSAAAMRIASS